MRKHVVYYLLLLILISYSFWNVVPFCYIGNNIVWLIIYVIYALYGFIAIAPKKKLLWEAGYNNYVWLIFLGIILSFIPAYLYYGQGIVTSIVVNRRLIWFFTLPLLLAIKPSYLEIKRALYIYTVIYLVVTVLDSWTPIPIIPQDFQHAINERHDYVDVEYGDWVHMLQGFQFVAIAFCFSLEDLRNKYTTKHFLTSFFIFLIILLTRNRTSLLACILIFGWTILQFHGKNSTLAKVVIILVAVVFASAAYPIFVDLFNETIANLGDESYNRNVSYLYFLSNPNGDIKSLFWGNGFISTSISTEFEDLAEIGISYSDDGFVGFWFQFGLLPVIVFAMMIIKSLSKRMPHSQRCSAVYMLVCALSNAYFAFPFTIVWFSLFSTMYCIADYEMNPVRIHKMKYKQSAEQMPSSR